MLKPYQAEPVSCWSALEKLAASFQRTEWVFRGHANACWALETTLERARRQWGVPWDELFYREAGWLRHFERHYHSYSLDAPAPGDYLELLALMQHHGAPTRLLDCTYSFYAATFFALEGSEETAAIWAFNGPKLDDLVKERVPGWKTLSLPENVRTMETFRCLVGNRTKFVGSLGAFRQNPRIAIQQGVFLCPGNIEASFEDNLTDMTGNPPAQDLVRKFDLPLDPGFRKAAMEHLRRMNMNTTTLYPGLDGFARSLRSWLPLPKEWLPPDSRYMPREG